MTLPEAHAPAEAVHVATAFGAMLAVDQVHVCSTPFRKTAVSAVGNVTVPVFLTLTAQGAVVFRPPSILTVFDAWLTWFMVWFSIWFPAVVVTLENQTKANPTIDIVTSSKSIVAMTGVIPFICFTNSTCWKLYI